MISYFALFYPENRMINIKKAQQKYIQ